MRRCAILAVVALWVMGAAADAASEQVREVWRSRYGTLRGAAANPADGSLWLLEGATVTRLAEDGSLLVRSRGLGAPAQLALDSRDGSCWVYEAGAGRFFRFSAAGEQLAAASGTTPTNPEYLAMAVSPVDGSLWAAQAAPGGTPAWVTHFDGAGQQLWRSPWNASSPVVDADQASAWVLDADAHAAVHVRGDGTELARVFGIEAVLAEDPADGSVWATDLLGELAHFPAQGDPLVAVANPEGVLGAPSAATVSPLDGSVWVQYFYSSGWLTAPGYHECLDGNVGSEVVHFAASGEVLGTPGIGDAVVGSGAPDGSVWVIAADGSRTVLIQVSADDQELRRLPDPYLLLSYQPGDNSLWVQDLTESGFFLRHVAQDGSILWEDPVPAYLTQLPGRSVDARDGSCWVQDWEPLEDTVHFVRYAPDGTELERRGLPDPIHTAFSLSISPIDASWWVSADTGLGTVAESVFHFTAGGTQLWKHDGAGGTVLVDARDGSAWAVQGFYTDDFGNPQLHGRLFHYTSTDAREAALDFGSLIQAPAVDPRDGSLWLVETDEQAVWNLVHLSVYGAKLGEVPVGGQFRNIMSLAVSPSDGSLLGVSGIYQGGVPGAAFRMARDGTVLWVVEGLWYPTSIALDPRDGSAWIAVGGEGDFPDVTGLALLHLAADGTELSREGILCAPTLLEFSPHDGTVWVTDLGNAQIVHVAAQAAVGPFSDVPADFWAAAAVEACAAAGIARGFADGSYRPNDVVTRDQMAVYIARALAGGDGQVPSGPAAASFTDVAIDFWAFRYVEYCQAKGVVTGYPDGLYHPGDQVTRAQMAVYITRCFVNNPTAPAQAVFPDVAADYWAARYIAYSKGKGIVQGYPDGNYHPEEALDRAQMAVYLQRAFGL